MSDDPLHAAWRQLYELGFISESPIACELKCSFYALRPHRDQFFDRYPEGPYTCAACGAERRKNEVHVDHVDRIHGNFGTHNCPENLRPLCGKCNRKRVKTRAPQSALLARDKHSTAARRNWENASPEKAAEWKRKLSENAARQERAGGRWAKA